MTAFLLVCTVYVLFWWWFHWCRLAD